MSYISKEEYVAEHFSTYELADALTDEQLDEFILWMGNMPKYSHQSLDERVSQFVADYPDWLNCNTDMFAPCGIDEGYSQYAVPEKLYRQAERDGINLLKKSHELLETALRYAFKCGIDYAMQVATERAEQYTSSRWE